ncbi:hypothetical protein MOV08_36715 [Streptomyces yunnanensis]|uniref:Uncharacterized protein n=1 Tax=Streptomyces yunnanensis TaxID=156453 RepID=A0ABY8AJC6_9ACTN|nr:hypothetical protein [Streptomyces yunnanensis]WEB44294.1 hypothetical protein MOV08_36715 [Streptomyces yunnanensis]
MPTDLACPNGHPVIMGSPAAGTSGPPKATLTRTATETAVAVGGGRVDAVAAKGSSVVLAAATVNDTELVEPDAATGKELHYARIRGMTASLNLTPTSAGWSTPRRQSPRLNTQALAADSATTQPVVGLHRLRDNP